MNRRQRRAIQQGKKKATIRIAQEGVGAESLGHDEQGHVVVVTDRGLAMLIAGLRTIALESPEVEPLLETLEGALADGIEARKAAAEAATTEAPVLVQPHDASLGLVSDGTSVSSSDGSVGSDPESQ